jgi:hypothetical protein
MSSYEHRHVNPNRNGITRSGNVSDSYPTDRHPSDARLDCSHWLLIATVFAALTCACLAVTIWADVPFVGVS